MLHQSLRSLFIACCITSSFSLCVAQNLDTVEQKMQSDEIINRDALESIHQQDFLMNDREQQNPQKNTVIDISVVEPDKATDKILSIFGGVDEKKLNEAVKTMLDALMDRGVQEQVKRASMRRMEMLNALPDQVREIVDTVSKDYTHLNDLIKVEKILLNLLEKITPTVTERQNAPYYDLLQESLGAFAKALKNGMFMRTAIPQQLAGNPDDPQKLFELIMSAMGQKTVEEPMKSYTQQDIKLLIEALELFAEDDEAGIVEDVQYSLEMLIKALQATESYDSFVITNLCIEIAMPDLESMRKVLSEAHSKLVGIRLEQLPDAEALLNEALEFWITQIQAYQDTLDSFLSLASHASIDLSPVLSKVAQIYDVASAFFNVNYFNYIANTHGNSHVYAAMFMDGAWRAAFVGALLANRHGDSSNQDLQKYVLGKGQLSKFANPPTSFEYVVSLFVSSVLQTGANPAVFGDRMHPVTRALCRIGGAYFWHTIMSRHYNPNVGPLNGSEVFRIACAATIREAQDYLDMYLKQKLVMNVDPMLMEQLEDYSLGLVKPALIDLSLEIIVPMIFLHKNNICREFVQLNFRNFLEVTRGSLWFIWYLQKRLNRFSLTDQDYDNNMRLYLEYKLVHYTCESLGAHFGGNIAHSFQEPLIGGLVALVQSLGYVLADLLNLVNPDNTYSQLIELVLDGGGNAAIYENYAAFRAMIASLFQEQSSERAIALLYLKGFGLLGEDVTNPLDINYRIIAALLFYCTNVRLLTHAQAGGLLEHYVLHYQYNVEPFIDLFVDRLKGNIVKTAGNIAGSSIGHILANKLLDRYGTVTV